MWLRTIVEIAGKREQCRTLETVQEIPSCARYHIYAMIYLHTL